MKKHFCKRLIIILVVLNIVQYPITVTGAFEPNDTNVISMTEEDLDEYYDMFSIKIMDKRTSSERIAQHFFFSFDVSDDEKIALLFDDATVVVFDKYGNVECILKFNEDILNTRSRSAAIKWNGENLELMLGYDVACLFSTEGIILDIWQYETHLTNIPNPSEITVSDYTYKMKSSNFFIRYTGGGNYDKLLKVSMDGNEKVLFETTKSIPSEAILLIIFVVVFNLTVAGVLISIFVTKRAIKKGASGYDFKRQGPVPH